MPDTVDKIARGDDLAQGRDLAADNRRKLAALFPGLLTEGEAGPAIDADALRDLVGATVDSDTREKFGLSWHGKAAARRLALTPSAAALRPAPDASVDWDATRNVLVEGDNLETLKLLQKAYAGRVKLIYIDPPYNTGKDFVYKDDFRDPLAHYLRLTGQSGDDGQKLTTNPETGGRFHTEWLNMIYPRLLLAREMLRQDGAIFVSIADDEVHHLRMLMDDIFGSENFIANIVWQKKQSPQNDATYISDMHDYVVVYARMAKTTKADKEGLSLNDFPKTDEQRNRFNTNDGDFRGPWTSTDLTCAKTSDERPNLYFPLIHPVNGKEVWPRRQRVWGYDREAMGKLVKENRVVFGGDETGTPRLKRFLSEDVEGLTPSTWWTRKFAGDNQAAAQELRGMFADQHGVFDTPKPTQLLRRVIEIATNAEGSIDPTDGTLKPDLVLDFFAGSGTTGHAVMEQNAADGGNRRFVLVQLPEPTGRADYPSIADLTAERLRRAGAKIKEAHPMFTGDTGFRVFKLDSANVRAWEAPTTDALEPGEAQRLIEANVEAVKGDRSDADLLWGVMLHLGLPLDGTVETREVDGRAVYVAGAGTLLACFAAGIDRPGGERLAVGLAGIVGELGVTGNVTVVLRDSAFAGDDAAKVNLVENLRQRTPEGVTARVRSI